MIKIIENYLNKLPERLYNDKVGIFEWLLLIIPICLGLDFLMRWYD